MKEFIYGIIGTISLAIIGGIIIVNPNVFAQIVSDPIAISEPSVSDTLSPQDDRKSFGYCPINEDTQTVLNKYGVAYEIEGCPLSRVYVDNWNKLDGSTQQAIVNEMHSRGYVMEKE